MACLRCGKKTEEKQAFCDACLEEMQKYPVKSGMAIQLPQRETTHPERKSPAHHREPEAAEQIAHLRKMIRWLIGMLALLSVLLLMVAGMLLHVLEKDTSTGIIGRNYTTSTQETQP